MRSRVLVLALALALAAAFLTRGAGRGAPPAAPPPTVPPTSLAKPAALPDWPVRDPFRYVDRRSTSEPEGVAPAWDAPGEAEAPEALQEPLRLVGFIRQGGRLLAALAIQGLVVTAAAGEIVEGYEVLSVSEDSGVRLRDARGLEVVLAPHAN